MQRIATLAFRYSDSNGHSFTPIYRIWLECMFFFVSCLDFVAATKSNACCCYHEFMWKCKAICHEYCSFAVVHRQITYWTDCQRDEIVNRWMCSVIQVDCVNFSIKLLLVKRFFFGNACVLALWWFFFPPYICRRNLYIFYTLYVTGMWQRETFQTTKVILFYCWQFWCKKGVEWVKIGFKIIPHWFLRDVPIFEWKSQPKHLIFT